LHDSAAACIIQQLLARATSNWSNGIPVLVLPVLPLVRRSLPVLDYFRSDHVIQPKFHFSSDHVILFLFYFLNFSFFFFFFLPFLNDQYKQLLAVENCCKQLENSSKQLNDAAVNCYCNLQLLAVSSSCL